MPTCPKCGHSYSPNKNRRICGLCKKPILKHHKYRFVKSRVQHRNCEHPTVYLIDGKHV